MFSSAAIPASWLLRRRIAGGAQRPLLAVVFVTFACAPGTGTAPTFDPLSGQGGSTGGVVGSGSAGSGSGAVQGTGGANGGGNGGSGNTANGGSGGTITTATGGTLGTGGSRVFDAGTAGNRNAVTAGNVCDRLATIQCAGEAYCCANPGRNFTACYDTQVKGCRDTIYLDAITANPVAGYDLAKAETAFTTFETMASQCDPAVAAWAISMTGLRGIVNGTKSPGADCTAPNLFDQPGAAGYLASCTDGGNYACSGPVTATWTCAARAAAGAPCFTDVNCQDGVYCDKPNLLSAGTCRARKGIGTACGASNECQSLTCKTVCVAADQQTAYCLQ